MEQFFIHRLEGENISISIFSLFSAFSYDERLTFLIGKSPLFSVNIDIGKQTEKIQKGNTWKWEDLKVVICSSNFHLDISSLSSPHICKCHHKRSFGLQNTNKSNQQLYSTKMHSGNNT